MDGFIIEILENIPEMFDIGPNDYDQVEKLQLLIKMMQGLIKKEVNNVLKVILVLHVIRKIIYLSLDL